MSNTFRVINYDGDIEISIYKKANAVFKTNEYSETEDVCVYKETINIFNLLKENQELKEQIHKGLYNVCLPYQTGYNKAIKDKKFLEEEFIEYMNKTIEELECDDVGDEEMKGYLIQRIDTFKEILRKYKSIIGGK